VKIPRGAAPKLKRWAATRPADQRRIPSEVEKSSMLRVTVVAGLGGSDLKSGTVRAIVRQLVLSWEAFHGGLTQPALLIKRPSVCSRSRLVPRVETQNEQSVAT